MPGFKFNSLKENQGATIDSYIAELKVLMVMKKTCKIYCLKTNIIFGVTVREIQEHLLNDIEDDHDLNHCLQEARKIESCIAQHKLLGLKSVQYDSIGNQRDWGRSKKKSKFKDRPMSRSKSSGGSNHQYRQCPVYGKTCKSCGKKNHSAIVLVSISHSNTKK